MVAGLRPQSGRGIEILLWQYVEKYISKKGRIPQNSQNLFAHILKPSKFEVMKQKSLIISLLFVLATVFTTLFFYSCTKEESGQHQQVNIDEEFGKYIKEITVYDANKENTAILLVGSDDESIVNMWSSQNFELIPVLKGEDVSDVLSTYYLSNNLGIDDNKEAATEDEDSDEVAASISYMFLSKTLKDDVEKVIIHMIDPYDDDMRGWKYSTEYSDAYGDGDNVNNTVTCNIYGQNFWHRGYYAIWYMKYSHSGWSTIKSEWFKIKNNENKSEYRTPCYKMKARRKYKGKNNNSVIIDFEY